jgi:hypothetical protein
MVSPQCACGGRLGLYSPHRAVVRILAVGCIHPKNRWVYPRGFEIFISIFFLLTPWTWTG